MKCIDEGCLMCVDQIVVLQYNQLSYTQDMELKNQSAPLTGFILIIITALTVKGSPILQMK